ncbi:cobalamin trafficking protein CblD [Caerostris darwini]|uniref:Cobalamin trafficking protein CblD n=1 Tax=Caerostris darwini TaxID=1538125 RepID=A0AAV4S466_9ARAC|nr:cobalamin trafficking protein CblD [Caerostris darwini]
MLIIARLHPHLQKQKYLTSYFRNLILRRNPAPISKANVSQANNDPRKEGYGEKEICLLAPIDIRAPFPGNIGVPSFETICTTKIKNLPKPAGDRWDLLIPLPAEKHHYIISQTAIVVNQKALSISDKLECYAHSCPELLKIDFGKMFPSKDLSQDDLSVITLCLKTENDMSTWSEEGEVEREKSSATFEIAARAISAYLQESGFWSDFIHPNTGKAHFNPVTNSTMFETDYRYRHFGFNIEDMGCCRIISHILWGTKIFVGAIFTNAPLETLEIRNIVSKDTDKITDSYRNPIINYLIDYAV